MELKQFKVYKTVNSNNGCVTIFKFDKIISERNFRAILLLQYFPEYEGRYYIDIILYLNKSNSEIIEASQEEIEWLEACRSANKFIQKSAVDRINNRIEKRNKQNSISINSKFNNNYPIY